MPHTEQAGQISVSYRAQLLAGTRTAANQAVSGLAQIDLDAKRQAIARALADWEQQAALTTATAQSQAAQLSHDYLQAYLRASEADPASGLDKVSLFRHVGHLEADGIAGSSTVGLAGVLGQASTAMLWMLGRGQGRIRAVSYAQSLATRTVSTGVTYAAGATLTDLMDASPEVTGWRRLCSSQTCRRCAERATHTYPAGAKMWRHPGDRCQQEPVVRGHSPLVRATPSVVRA